MKKYNILFIGTIHNYFIKDHASFNRMYNILISFYKHKDFNIFVLHPKRDKENEIQELKSNIKTFYFREIKIFRNNLIKLLDFNPFFFFKVRSIVKKYQIDLIHIEYPFGINILRLLRKIPISYNTHNVEYIFSNWVDKYDKKLPKIIRPFYVKSIYLLEKYATNYAININAVSISDKKKFLKIYQLPEEKILVLPIGYNKEIFNYPLSKNLARKRLKISENKYVVIFHGNFANYANQEAINIIKNKIAPKVKKEEILFLIAGKMPYFKNRDNLKFLGYVNDLKELIYSADIAIAPIFRGSGINTKILDYLSGCIPVIVTKIGAEGLPLKNEYNSIITKNSIREIVEKIIFLHDNPNKTQEMKKNIKKILKNELNWNIILDKITKRYKNILENFS